MRTRAIHWCLGAALFATPAVTQAQERMAPIGVRVFLHGGDTVTGPRVAHWDLARLVVETDDGRVVHIGRSRTIAVEERRVTRRTRDLLLTVSTLGGMALGMQLVQRTQSATCRGWPCTDIVGDREEYQFRRLGGAFAGALFGWSVGLWPARVIATRWHRVPWPTAVTAPD